MFVYFYEEPQYVFRTDYSVHIDKDGEIIDIDSECYNKYHTRVSVLRPVEMESGNKRLFETFIKLDRRKFIELAVQVSKTSKHAETIRNVLTEEIEKIKQQISELEEDIHTIEETLNN